jgi:hypothetical protein
LVCEPFSSTPKSRFGETDRGIAFNICVTFPVIFFLFKDTTQVSLEDIDLLFGEPALRTLPEDLHKENIQTEQVVVDARTKEEVEGAKA